MGRLSTLGAVCAIVCAFALPAAAQSVEVVGLDGVRTTLAGDGWTALPRETLDLTAHGQTHSYSGPLLATILASVNAPLGQALRGSALKSYVLVRSADNYGVVLSLAEVDPAMRTTRVILADRVDGQPIGTEDGPLRLVVEGDARPARSAKQVTAIELRRAD